MEGGLDRKGMSVAVLKTALVIEEFGIGFYDELSRCVVDEKGSALMRSLRDDEREHASIIHREMERLLEGGSADGIEPLREYLDVLPHKVFDRPEGACLALADEIAALQKGIEVEVNSIRMYQDALSRAIDPGTRATVQELIRWEFRHREILEENLRTLKLGGAWYGYGPILEG